MRLWLLLLLPALRSLRSARCFVNGFTVPTNRYAILVDAENASQSSFELAMEDLQERGLQFPIRRIFGPSATLEQQSWKAIVQQNSIVPIYTQTLADVELTVDAMDILYTKDIDGFVLFSSDGDFTRLCQRIRESNLTIIGVGQRRQAAESLARACHDYLYTDDFEQGEKLTKNKVAFVSSKKQRKKQAEEAILEAKEMVAREAEEWAMNQAADKTRLEVEAKAQKAKEREGLPTDMVTTGFRQFIESFRALARGPQQAVDSLKSVGDASTNSTVVNGFREQSTANASTKKKTVADSKINNKVADAKTDDEAQSTSERKVVKMLKTYLNEIAPQNEWIRLSVLVQISSVDAKMYGYYKMSNLMQAHSNDFEMKKVKSDVFVRNRVESNSISP